MRNELRMRKLGLLLLLSVFVVVPVGAISCGAADEGPAEPAPQDLTITIGVITDKTGPAANAYIDIDLALADIVRYYNEEDIIPGVKLEVITYDGQFDPSRDIPGYEWLRGRGADVIYSAIESSPVVLRNRVDRDEVVMFAGSAQKEALDPPGWIFAPAQPQEEAAYTFLGWLAENDWDYEAKGPARIGLTNWNVPLDVVIAGTMETYCDDHPDQFEWVGSYFTDFGFNWGAEVQALQSCDYVMPPTVSMATFAREYRGAGYTAKFIGYDAHLAYFGLVADAGVWDLLDGSLFYRGAEYWNEDGAIITLTRELLYRYHPDEAEDIIRSGIGYTALLTAYEMLEIIRQAIELVGVEGFDSRALRNAAEGYSLSMHGLDDYANFSPTKRTSFNYIAVYELGADCEDIFRLEPGVWHHLVELP